MKRLKGGKRREIGIRKPQTSRFCKKGAIATPIIAALAQAAEPHEKCIFFFCILKETSTFWVRCLAWNSLSAIDVQMLFEKLLSVVMG